MQASFKVDGMSIRGGILWMGWPTDIGKALDGFKGIESHSFNVENRQFSVRYDTKVIDLEKYFKTENSVAYLRTKVWSDKKQPVLFELGSDDGIKVWLNKKLVHHNNIMRGHSQGEDITGVTLAKGWNTILIKVTQGIGGWEASLVITDLEGEPLKGLKYKSN